MKRYALVAAATTGAFCAVFTLTVDTVMDALTAGEVVVLSFTSGFLGSLFARAVLKREDRT